MNTDKAKAELAAVLIESSPTLVKVLTQMLDTLEIAERVAMGSIQRLTSLELRLESLETMLTTHEDHDAHS